VRRVLLLGALLALAAPASGARSGGTPVALVTAETLNQLIAVELPSGRVLRRIALPADPQNVEARPGVRIAVVVSVRAGVVSLVDTERLRVMRRLGGFRSPHIAALTPDDKYAYVTDDGSGKLNVIDLARRRVIRRVFVGIGAHHLGISPDGRRTWVALGEHAHSIIVLNTSRPARPRVMRRVRPRGTAHDLAFTPSGARIWVTSADNSQVGIYDARTRRLLKSFSGGSPPQHVAFLSGCAYVTSGYAGTMQIRDAESGRLRRTVRTAYGSFNLGLGGGLVLTSSLLRGTLTELDNTTGRRLGQWHLAPATRDVALTGRR
jgi:YVTN family beta-propeller protein